MLSCDALGLCDGVCKCLTVDVVKITRTSSFNLHPIIP